MDQEVYFLICRKAIVVDKNFTRTFYSVCIEATMAYILYELYVINGPRWNYVHVGTTSYITESNLSVQVPGSELIDIVISKKGSRYLWYSWYCIYCILYIDQIKVRPMLICWARYIILEYEDEVFLNCKIFQAMYKVTVWGTGAVWWTGVTLVSF